MSETVKIPKAMADAIRNSRWFRFYNDLDEFVTEAVRKLKHEWMMAQKPLNLPFLYDFFASSSDKFKAGMLTKKGELRGLCKLAFTAQQFLDWMYHLARQYGYLGVFLTSFVGAVTIIFPLPYTLVVYLMGGLLNPLFVAISSGLGSAVGEFSGYVLGYYGRTMVREEHQKKMNYMVKVFDRYGPAAIFLFALTPLPDDLLFIPLGIMRYNFVKAFIPCFLGKLSMCFILAYSGKFSIKLIEMIFGEGGWLGAILTTIFLILIIVAMLKIDWEKVFEKYVGEGRKKKV